MNDTRANYSTIVAMQRFGGRFVRSLAETWLCADQNNRYRLEDAFPELFARYRDMAQTMTSEVQA